MYHKVTDKDLAPLALLVLVWLLAGHILNYGGRFNVAFITEVSKMVYAGRLLYVLI